ncbi:hypothetical protein A3731_10140 [Roseovarius sp. HI0049]|nr:hypothetical protein A3731_10140 [Roseovarius sp. HI0049]
MFAKAEVGVTYPMSDRPSYSAPALTKGLDILELLSKHDGGLTLKEMAGRLERTVNEIFRMVSVLEDNGFIRMGPDNQYVLTLRLFEIAHRHPPVKSLIENASPHMHQFSNATHQSCHLSVYQGGKAVIIAQVESPERWSFNMKIGAMLELVESASGLTLLTFQAEDRRQQMLEEYEKAFGTLPTSVSKLQRDMSSIQRQGYCVMESQHVAGVTNISFPILGIEGNAIAALTVPYLKHISDQSIPLQDIPENIRVATQGISRMNGYSSEIWSL